MVAFRGIPSNPKGFLLPGAGDISAPLHVESRRGSQVAPQNFEEGGGDIPSSLDATQSRRRARE
ncbi:hypothetical protein N7532_001620 [Penicillium argentinense]|uniref:Uncharacterized protein n=1 Tax=Penicillium argentinense TaxID=1131581 RepID=A0A9W9G2U4_9EURO|nr:uncharacterized protein N7532_001620 [Penicillium argentinense]KAJ5111085.1 hypothetical protein N7532_001620 [Penicillium argentinense]